MLSENGEVIKIDTTGRQITRSCGSSLDRRCSVDTRKRYENDEGGRKSFEKGAKQLRFCLKTD